MYRVRNLAKLRRDPFGAIRRVGWWAKLGFVITDANADFALQLYFSMFQ